MQTSRINLTTKHISLRLTSAQQWLKISYECKCFYLFATHFLRVSTVQRNAIRVPTVFVQQTKHSYGPEADLSVEHVLFDSSDARPGSTGTGYTSWSPIFTARTSPTLSASTHAVDAEVPIGVQFLKASLQAHIQPTAINANKPVEESKMQVDKSRFCFCAACAGHFTR